MWVLIATILVLAITVTALITVFDSYKASQQQMSVQNMQSQLSSAIGAINTAFAQNRDFSQFNNTVAKSIGAVPQSWIQNSGGSYDIPDGGKVSFSAGPVPNQYRITISGLSQQFCIGLGTYVVPQMVNITIGTTTYNNPAYGTASGSWPPIASNVAANCNVSGNNTVTYTLQ